MGGHGLDLLEFVHRPSTTLRCRYNSRSKSPAVMPAVEAFVSLADGSALDGHPERAAARRRPGCYGRRMDDRDGRLRYRLLTGPDDAEFCRRVSGALTEGYRLHGSPAMTFDGRRVVVAQALVWDDGPDARVVPA
nr:DUF1737 domain-containing protein [Micromonospora sp. KC606]